MNKIKNHSTFKAPLFKPMCFEIEKSVNIKFSPQFSGTVKLSTTETACPMIYLPFVFNRYSLKKENGSYLYRDHHGRSIHLPKNAYIIFFRNTYNKQHVNFIKLEQGEIVRTDKTPLTVLYSPEEITDYINQDTFFDPSNINLTTSMEVFCQETQKNVPEAWFGENEYLLWGDVVFNSLLTPSTSAVEIEDTGLQNFKVEYLDYRTRDNKLNTGDKIALFGNELMHRLSVSQNASLFQLPTSESYERTQDQGDTQKTVKISIEKYKNDKPTIDQKRNNDLTIINKEKKGLTKNSNILQLEKTKKDLIISDKKRDYTLEVGNAKKIHFNFNQKAKSSYQNVNDHKEKSIYIDQGTKIQWFIAENKLKNGGTKGSFVLNSEDNFLQHDYVDSQIYISDLSMHYSKEQPTIMHGFGLDVIDYQNERQNSQAHQTIYIEATNPNDLLIELKYDSVDDQLLYSIIQSSNRSLHKYTSNITVENTTFSELQFIKRSNQNQKFCLSISSLDQATKIVQNNPLVIGYTVLETPKFDKQLNDAIHNHHTALKSKLSKNPYENRLFIELQLREL